MDAKLRRWELKIIQDRYHPYKITLAQAQLIEKYEQEKNSFPSEHYLSVWEEMDYERSYFQEIFTAKQMKVYEEHHQNAVDRYRDSLIEGDSRHQKEVGYLEEQLHFVENKLLPSLQGKEMMMLNVWIRDEPTKYAFLRSEYQQFLLRHKAQIITAHFRHYRTYQPTLLKASLLRHDILSLWPDYAHFKGSVDEPTKAVANHLEQKVKRVPDDTASFIQKKMQPFSAFHSKLFKKYYGNEGGWHVIVDERSEKEQMMNLLMGILLLESKQEAYGYL
ncbi:MAG: hypothetical protein EOP04_27245 [Proteobacteria bacterium]|nr:MAG: hypothetical protein EOP04_27245 [Pseudomonadota bacterium]